MNCNPWQNIWALRYIIFYFQVDKKVVFLLLLPPLGGKAASDKHTIPICSGLLGKASVSYTAIWNKPGESAHLDQGSFTLSLAMSGGIFHLLWWTCGVRAMWLAFSGSRPGLVLKPLCTGTLLEQIKIWPPNGWGSQIIHPQGRSHYLKSALGLNASPWEAGKEWKELSWDGRPKKEQEEAKAYPWRRHS